MALYDMRIIYDETEANDWYGPYELSDEDVREIKPGVALLKRTLELRPHECDDPTESGSCGHLREGDPAPY